MSGRIALDRSQFGRDRWSYHFPYVILDDGQNKLFPESLQYCSYFFIYLVFDVFFFIFVQSNVNDREYIHRI